MSTQAGPLSPGPADSPGPVAPAGRIEALDILRGFALFGILLVDMRLFVAEPGTRADAAAKQVIEFLGHDSFFPLFSLLFGLGFAIQMTRAEARGIHFVPIYVRRLLVLLFIGIAHNILTGSAFYILVRYALMGFPLLLFRHCARKTLLVWAVACLFFAISAFPVKAYIAEQLRVSALRNADSETQLVLERQAAEEQASAQRDAAEFRQALAKGTYADLVRLRAKRFVRTMSGSEFYLTELPDVFTIFLLGLYAARRGIFRNPSAHLRLLRTVMWWGLGVGLLGNTFDAIALRPLESLGFLGGWLLRGASRFVGGFALTFCYASVLLLLLQHQAWKKRLIPLAWPGRMALTNYLGQWALCAAIFYGYGLGLYQTVGLVTGVVLTFAIYGAEIVLSKWWLQGFRFGPAEWLWRTLTYGKLQAMRVQNRL